MLRAVSILTIVAFGLSACTTTLTSRTAPSLQDGFAPEGIEYRLPMLQYVVTGTYTLTSCTPNDEGLLPLHLDVTATGSTIEGEARVVSYSTLAAKFKTTSFNIEFWDDTRLVKSINASATDKGPEIAANVLKAGVAIARMAVGAPGGGGKPDEVRPVPLACADGLDAVVQASELARKGIAALPDQIQATKDRIALYTTKAQLGILTLSEKKAAAADLAASKALDAKLAAFQKQADAAAKRLTFAIEWRYPDATGPVAPKMLLATSGRAWFSKLVANPDANGAQIDKEIASMAVAAALTPAVATTPCDPKSEVSCRAISVDAGFAYRTPAPGIFKVCRNPAPLACGADPKPLVTEAVSVPQFGRMMVLPLRNGWGEDNNFSATFSKTGNMLTFKYEAKSAPIEKATGVIADAATQIGSIAKDLKAQNAADATAAAAKVTADQTASLAAIQSQIDILNKQAELAKLQAAAADPATTEHNSEVDQLNAQIALLQLQKQRKELLDALATKP
ncbi:FlxA-like family protein [Novosphingobium pokkalii]|uniref:FlxA-like family protein n=1 Tax=Novosphingobium pokkalii TaxID=1770194 RepID=A0ABV7V0D1_9SPHN|nr:FlxA-like family protein [Novosphingobium pokkalii]GHD02477.1 hypothetical protein GCM10019060_37860 [Novosphingobium pokkalii]